MGKSGLMKQIKRQKSYTYYDLLLNDETSRYVFRILAIKEIFENPKNMAFNLDQKIYIKIYLHFL